LAFVSDGCWRGNRSKGHRRGGRHHFVLLSPLDVVDICLLVGIHIQTAAVVATGDGIRVGIVTITTVVIIVVIIIIVVVVIGVTVICIVKGRMGMRKSVWIWTLLRELLVGEIILCTGERGGWSNTGRSRTMANCGCMGIGL